LLALIFPEETASRMNRIFKLTGVHVKITETQLRSGIRQMIQEDLAGFVKRTKGIRYDPPDTPLFSGSYNKDDKEKARAIKRAWAEEVDRDFIQSLTLVHWIGSGSKLVRAVDRKLSVLPNRSRDEISTAMYLPGDAMEAPWMWRHVGIQVKGYVTLAANKMDDIYSGYIGKTSKKERQAHKSSGLPRRPGVAHEVHLAGYALDRSSFERNQPENEAIVDNWKPVALVIDTTSPGRQAHLITVFQLAIDAGLPVIDSDGQPTTIDKVRSDWGIT